MSVYTEEDTIAAIATPLGEGGIAIVRISGPEAFPTADKGFRGKVKLCDAASHTAHFGEFFDPLGNLIDQVVATVFRSPHSYTSEDTVELSCHGGPYVAKQLLQAVLSSGARHAGPGEFTRKAFLNGKIDLAQAEAVADLIHARTEQSRKASIEQLEGKLSTRINELREQLLKTCSLLELELDFSEEGLEFVDKSNIIKDISATSQYINELIASYSIGKIYRDGVKVVIAGKPNVGKSSLLNRILNDNRAIVTEIPGTTRDVIEESIVLGGVLFRIVDTAGIRFSQDIVESEGIRRTNKQIETADIVCLVVDPTQGYTDEDEEILENLRQLNPGVEIIFIQNKCDIISDGIKEGEIARRNPVKLSAKTGEGLQDLLGQLQAHAIQGYGGGAERSVTITNIRHKERLERALESLDKARASIEMGMSNELIAVDIHAGLNCLGEIIGVVTSEDILNSIFAKFCIGK